MRFSPARVLPCAVLALSAVAVPSPLTTPAAQATESSTVAAEPQLPRPARGQEAIRLLGDSLDEAAALSSWTPRQLRDVLSTDPTAWVDQEGHVYYQDRPRLAGASAGSEAQPAQAAYPLAETFLLHSKPDSTRTIFIDFDGTNVSNTAWNTSKGVPNGDYPAWSLDGDSTTFNDAERTAIQSVWQRVAEDYAPFDVDVTTEDPGPAGIVRTNSADQVYGTRALVTPSTVAEGAICGPPPSCGGVAYVNVFGEVEPGGSSHQPAWVFPQSLGNDTKNIAEAVSHEVGHNFSLQHDGRSVPSEGYYAGHAMWAPIMGNSYNRPVTQWSMGEYAGANNALQDDVALIAARAPYRADEAGGTVATAAPAVPATGFLTDRSDTDTFALGTCSGTVTVQATGATPSPNLDLRLELLDSTGVTVASADPASVSVSRDSAGGLAASISTSVPAGAYFARVDGVGNGTGLTGYTDYGSVGAYGLSSSGCAPAGSTTPGTPTQMTVGAEANGRSAIVTWSPPASDGGSAIIGYRLTRTGGGTVDVGTVGSHTWSGLTPGATYTFTVAARNAVGTGSPAAQDKTLPDVAGPPTDVTVSPAADGRSTTVTWSPPASDGGSAVSGYRLTRTGGGTVDVGLVGSHTWSGLTRGATYTFTVAALNGVGAGPAASKTAMTPDPPAPATAVPGPPTIGKATSGRPGGVRTAVFRWTAPAATGGLPVTAYYVQVQTRGKHVQTVRVAPGRTTFKLKSAVAGAFRVVVLAENAAGASAPSAASKAVRVR